MYLKNQIRKLNEHFYFFLNEPFSIKNSVSLLLQYENHKVTFLWHQLVLLVDILLVDILLSFSFLGDPYCQIHCMHVHKNV